MERGEAHHCLPAASRFCNGTEPIQPEDNRAFDGKRGRMPAEIFKAKEMLICRTDALKNPGKQKESAAGKSGGFLLFRGRGQGGTQCPLSGVPGVKLPARVKDGKPLSGCRGAARPVDERLARTEAERRPTCPAPGRGRKAPPNRVAVYGSPYWVLPAENGTQKPRFREAGSFEKSAELQKQETMVSGKTEKTQQQWKTGKMKNRDKTKRKGR